MILASDDGHKKVFSDVPMISFKINKNLNAHLAGPKYVEEKDLIVIYVKIWKARALSKANI